MSTFLLNCEGQPRDHCTYHVTRVLATGVQKCFWEAISTSLCKLVRKGNHGICIRAAYRGNIAVYNRAIGKRFIRPFAES